MRPTLLRALLGFGQLRFEFGQSPLGFGQLLVESVAFFQCGGQLLAVVVRCGPLGQLPLEFGGAIAQLLALLGCGCALLDLVGARGGGGEGEGCEGTKAEDPACERRHWRHLRS